MHLLRAGAIMGFEALVSKLGHNPIHLLTEVGLSSAQLRDPNTHVSYLCVANLLDLASDVCQDPYFGLRLASTQSPHVIGELSFLAAAQSSVQDVMANVNQHLHLHAEGAHIKEQISGDYLQSVISLDFNNDTGLKHLVQMSIGQMSSNWFIGSPPGRHFSMHLVQGQPQDPFPTVGKYQSYLVYGSKFNGLQYPVSWQSRKLEQDPNLLRDYFQDRVQQLEEVHPYKLPERLQHLLSDALDTGGCTLERMAASLNLHPRLLQKRLKQEGTSFTKLLQQTRENIACHSLQQDNTSVTDLALKLGYSEVAVFSRHFKRWTGYSPRAWRKRNQLRTLY